MKKIPPGTKEQRQFIRVDFAAPLAYKVCKRKTIAKLLKGFIANISQSGLLCKIKDKVKKKDILWLSFERGTLSICEEIERRSLIYQNGIIGKVVRVKPIKNKLHEVGIQFLTREEKNESHIYPKFYFLQKKGLPLPRLGEVPEETEEEDAEEEL